MWKSAYVGVYLLLNWKMHGETLKYLTNDMVTESENLTPPLLKSTTGHDFETT